MKIITIKDAIIDGKFLKKGSEMDVDKERQREFKVLGIIENPEGMEIKKAVLMPTEKRKRR
jgi:hypothetical protein